MRSFLLANAVSGLYVLNETSNTWEFDTSTQFYADYEWNIKTAASNGCMESKSVPQQDGTSVRYQPIYWPDQKNSKGEVIDYEKCIYVFKNANGIDHATANMNCNTYLVPATGSGCDPSDCVGQLVSIHNENTNTMIYQSIVDDPENNGWPHWIGLRAYCKNCKLEWDDHSPLDYTNWYPGEPNNAGDGEECVQMYIFENGAWNDNNCNEKTEYICQMPISNTHPRPSMDATWSSGNCCYRTYAAKFNKGTPGEPDRMTFQAASQFCSSATPNGKLAMLPNIYYQYFINSMMRNNGYDAWIGALRSTADMTFSWIDNSRITYNFWQNGEPNNWEGVEDKVEIKWYSDNQFNWAEPGNWNDQYSEETRAFVCFDKQSPGNTETKPNPLCPDGWQAAPQVNGFCYKLITGQNTDFKQASSYCQGLESKYPTELASVEDIYEANFLTSMLYSTETNYDPTLGGLKAVWIGLQGYKTNANVKFEWMDGMPLLYTRWGLNEPNNDAINMDPARSCVYMDNNRDWHVDKACNLALPFICKANVGGVDPNPAADDRGDYLDCPLDWMASQEANLGHHCLKAYSQALSWFEADGVCKAAGGARLASIHSDHSNDRVKAVFAARTVVPGAPNKDTYWIGLNRNPEGGFTYTDGSPVDYTNWAAGEPSESWNGEAEDCVRVYNTGQWNDDTCSDKFPFVCKIPRPMSKCIDIAELDKKQCGYPGISEYACLHELKCCYNGADIVGISCYHPTGRKINGGVTPGAAAGITSAVFIAIIMAMGVYFLMFADSAGSGGFSNPLA